MKFKSTILLIFTALFFLGSSSAQVNTFPFIEGFETNFTTGSDVEFIPNWIGNSVLSGGRVFQSSNARTGNNALGLTPAATFDPAANLLIDLTGRELAEINFWMASAKNGTGTRPTLIRMRTSIDNGVTWGAFTTIDEVPNEDEPYAPYSYALPASADGAPNVWVQIEASTGAGGTGTRAIALIDDLELDADITTTPLISATQINIIELDYSFANGGPSDVQSYELSASNLVGTGDIELEVSSDFEISLSNNQNFGNSLDLPFSNGEIDGQPLTVYVRLKENLALGNYTGNITHFGGNADTLTVNLSGSVFNTFNPELFDLSTGDFYFGEWAANSPRETFPSNMRFTFTNDPSAVNYDPLRNGNSLYNCAYDFGLRNRINGRDTDGVSFFATGTGQFDACETGTAQASRFVGAAVVGLNTTGVNYARIEWLNRLISQTSIGREFVIRLQYRIGGNGDYSDFVDTPQYTAIGKANGSFEWVEYELPAFLLNESEVYLRLLYFQEANNGGGTRPEIGIDEITITSNPIRNYYSKATGNLSDASTWNTKEDGSGFNADNFTDDNQVFVFNRANGTLSDNLTIGGNDSKLVIENSSELTVDAELTLNVELENNGTLTLASGATILTNNGLAGTGTYNVEQFLTGSGGATPNGRFWYLGTPIEGANSGVFNAAGDSRMWSYSETSGGYTMINDNATSMTNGEGYVLRMADDETVTFSGNSIKNGAYTFAGLSRNMARPEADRGIHLWANPYPSHLDWNATNRTNMSNTFQYRTFNGANMVFDSYNAVSGIGTNNNGQGAIDQYIPPFQAVWVRSAVDNETGTIAVDNSMRSHQSGNLLKSGNDNEIIRIHLSDGNVYDETVVYFNANAENDFDAYDSYKMMINSHQIYSIENNKKLVMNGLQNALTKEKVALGIEIPNTGAYSIVANELSTYENVVLEDKKLEKFQDLKTDGKYQFQSAEGIDEDRFVLHFNILLDDITNTNDAMSNEDVKIFQFNGNQVKVIIDSQSYENGLINIYNMTGAMVVSQQVERRENILSLDVASGIYMVEVISNKNKTAKKLMIK